MLNHADVIGDQSDGFSARSVHALCCHLWRDININTNQGESWERFSVPRICRWESNFKCAGN